MEEEIILRKNIKYLITSFCYKVVNIIGNIGKILVILAPICAAISFFGLAIYAVPTNHSIFQDLLKSKWYFELILKVIILGLAAISIDAIASRYLKKILSSYWRSARIKSESINHCEENPSETNIRMTKLKNLFIEALSERKIKSSE